MRKILIVDDEHEVSLAGRVLSKRRYTIIQANSTKEALASVVEDDIWALFITRHRLAVDEGMPLAFTAANAGVRLVAFPGGLRTGNTGRISVHHQQIPRPPKQGI